MTEKTFADLRKLNPGRYELCVHEVSAIRDKSEGDRLSEMRYAFLLGFQRGQRAEKARSKEKRVNADG